MNVPNGPRLAATDAAGETPAEQWREILDADGAWGGAAGDHGDTRAITGPPIAIDPGRLVVVAPHPDDEVLGLGATLAARAARSAPEPALGRSLDRSADDPTAPGFGDAFAADVVLCVSDGAASHPGEVDEQEMRRRRKAECEAGARELGIDLVMLGLPDGGLTPDAVDAALHPVLDDLAPHTVAVTWSGDGHPDHHACAESVKRWCRDRGRAGDHFRDEPGPVVTGAGSVTLLEFPVWMWHWAAPGDPDVPWGRLRRVALAHLVGVMDGEWAGGGADGIVERAFEHKRRALAAHASQLVPQSDAPDAAVILPEAVTDRFFLGAEWVFTP